MESQACRDRVSEGQYEALGATKATPVETADAVPGEVYEGPRRVNETSRRPQGRLAPVGPDPPVNGSLRSAAVTRSLQASCPAAGRRERLQNKQEPQRSEPCRRGSRRLQR